MKTIIYSLLIFMSAELFAKSQWHVDFSDPNELQYWYRVNDSVMGGVSRSNLRIIDNIALFEGVLSMQNNGGFASVRRVGPMSLASDSGPIKLRVLGDGRSFQLRLRTNRSMDGVAYVAGFNTTAGQWQTVSFAEQDFVAQFRGRIISDAPSLAFIDVKQIGFMLADKKPGQFALAIDYLSQ